MAEAGILEQKEGLGGNGGKVNYWAFTRKGSEFGENKAWPQNKDVTQPLYYEGKFDELLKKTSIKKQL